MKAVVWTDIFQSFVMLAGLVVTVVAGIIRFGSLTEIVEVFQERGRLRVE